MSAAFFALHRLRSVRVAGAIHVAVAVAMVFIPLFDVMGFERAFASSLLAAPTTAAIALGAAKRARAAGGEDPLRVFLHAAMAGVVLLAPTVLAGLAVEAFTRPCDPGEGALFVLLLGGPGAVFGAALGLAAGSLTTRRVIPGALVSLALLADLARAALRFHESPQIYAYSVPFGYWPGSIYDEGVGIDAALGWQRAMSAALAIGLALLVRALADRRTLLSFRAFFPASLLGAAPFLVAAAAIAERGEALGFDRTTATVERALSRRSTDDACAIFADPSIAKSQLEALAADCRFRAAQLERFFGGRPPVPVRVFVYRDLGQKKALMGAAGTQIARPWAHEIHIHGFELPHPVLKHELAHVFAARFAEGPLGVPAAAFVFPNLGVVEGIAVAADWSADRLTVHEWANAMRKLGLAPSLTRTLYPSGFWAVSSARAYTVAGSFLRHLVDTRGIEAFGRLYASNDFRAAYGSSLEALIADWERFLDGLPLDEASLAIAEHRFRQPGIFEKVCAHTTAALRDEGHAQLAAGDLEGGAKTLERVAEYRARSTEEHLALARAFAAAERWDEARAYAERAIAREGISLASRAAATAALADLEWRAGHLEAAKAGYQAASLAGGRDADERLLDAKLAALERPREVQAVLRDYLLGELPRPRAGIALLRLVHADPGDGLVRYLLARLLEQLEATEEALSETRAALAAGLPGARIPAEAERMIGRQLLALGRAAEAQAQFRGIAPRTAAERVELEDWAERAGIEVDRTSFGR